MKINTIRKDIKQNKGITLVALVITIIILIILAGISISIVLGPEGLIAKASKGAQSYNEEAIKEQGELDKINTLLDNLNLGGSTTPTDPPAPQLEVTLAEARSDAMLTKTTNSTYTDTTYTGTNKVVTIPAGYKMTEDTDKIAEGIVIQDASGNQFVWIPVNEPMADTLDPAVELGGTGKAGGKTTALKSKSGLLSGITRENIAATSGYREPDIVTSYDKSDNASTYLNDAGFTTASTALVDFAEDLSLSYKKMIESVEYYGGFYVGRYEITGTLENPTEKPGWPITGTNGTAANTGEQSANWYKLYKACKEFTKTKTSATSRMMWGCTWDEICKFIANKGYTDSNSNEFGNYSNSVDSNGNAVEGRGSKQQTGSKEIWSACNIYDIAGNCYEWTQEAYGTSKRALRGR